MKALLAAAIVASAPMQDPDPLAAAAIGGAVPLVLGLTAVTYYQLDHYTTMHQVALAGQVSAISLPVFASVSQVYAGDADHAWRSLGLAALYVVFADVFGHQTTSSVGCLDDAPGSARCDVVPDHLAWLSVGVMVALASIYSGLDAYWTAEETRRKHLGPVAAPEVP